MKPGRQRGLEKGWAKLGAQLTSHCTSQGALDCLIVRHGEPNSVSTRQSGVGYRKTLASVGSGRSSLNKFQRAKGSAPERSR
jgi:hypothetical protein